MKKTIIKIAILNQILIVLLFGQKTKGSFDFFKTNNIESKPINDSAYVDPYSFFPSQVGNFWQYSGNNLSEERITKDSILSDGSKYLYINGWTRPTYQIDTNYTVIFDPFYEIPETLFVLNAEKDDKWWVKKYYEDSILVGGYTAKVTKIYEGNFLGKDAVFKVISDYVVFTVGNSLIEEWNHDIVLASGIGIVYEDIEAEAPKYLISAIINGDTLGTIVGIEDGFQNSIPNSFTLYQNYPNPFNSSTIIQYKIVEPDNYRMILTNILGEIIETNEYKFLQSGVYQKGINLNNFSSGIYFYTLFNNKKQKTIKMIYLK